MDAPVVPRCWKCGYELRGLRVEQLCPECGTPIWSTPPPLGAQPAKRVSRDAQLASNWGLGALALFFLCAGPLALFAAIPAIILGMRARAALRAGRIDDAAAKGAMTGIICGWIVVALCVAYAVVLLNVR